MNTHLTVVYLILTLLNSTALAQQAVVTPYRYPIKHPTRASSALKKYKEMLLKIDTIKRSASITGQPNLPIKYEPFDCPGLDSGIYKCVDDGHVRYYVDKYLPYISNSPALVPTSGISSMLEGGAAVTGWVPVEKAFEGHAALKRLQEMMEKKELDNCNDETGDCTTVVEAIPVDKGERVLAVCDVPRIGEETGAVRNCAAVAIITPDASYIRAVVGYKRGQAIPIKQDEWQATTEYRIEKGSDDAPMPSAAAVLGAARSALDSKFLKLTTELLPKDNPVRAIGIGALRRNFTMGSFREKVSFKVEVDRSEVGEFSIKVAFNLQVNEQGRDRAEEFRPPSDVEIESYKVALDQGIWRQILQLCKLQTSKELRTAVCHKPIERPQRSQSSGQ
jgi:hypothetical protein